MRDWIRGTLASPLNWVVVFTVLLVGVGTGIAWKEQNPEWVSYQRAFMRLAQDRASRPEQVEWYLGQRLEIQQITVAALGVVDRCTTCHLAVSDPSFITAPEPFRAHSDILKTHPPDQFGCTACHWGEGRAVTTLAAHGIDGNSTHPLLRGEYMEAACVMCHAESTLPLKATRVIAAGEQIINELDCLRCHRIGRAGESEGPDLSGIGSRRTPNELYAHLLNPPSISLGSTMPIFPVTRTEAQAITAFLLTGQERQVSDVHYLARKAASDVSLPPAPLDLPPILFFSYDGRALYRGEGCSVCHRIGKEGGNTGPALNHVARVREREWLVRYLRDPASIRPSGRMPQLYLNDREINALVDYLVTLR